jgi:cell division protein FtsB
VAASRRPGPRRGTARPAARSTTRAAGRSAAPPPAPAPPAADQRGSGLTTRAAVLGLVVCALVLSFALPLREYLAQRGEINRLQQDQAAQRERVAALEELRDRLQDPAYLASEARRRLHYVMPGETAYVVLTPDEVAAQAGALAADGDPAGEQAPWYARLWGSLQEADRADGPGAAQPGADGTGLDAGLDGGLSPAAPRPPAEDAPATGASGRP